MEILDQKRLIPFKFSNLNMFLVLKISQQGDDRKSELDGLFFSFFAVQHMNLKSAHQRKGKFPNKQGEKRSQ